MRLIDANDAKEVLYEVETPCLICGEGVPIWVSDSRPTICEKCKAAVMYIRNQTDSGDKKD